MERLCDEIERLTAKHEKMVKGLKELVKLGVNLDVDDLNYLLNNLGDNKNV